jgi:hypothetical protein
MVAQSRDCHSEGRTCAPVGGGQGKYEGRQVSRERGEHQQSGGPQGAQELFLFGCGLAPAPGEVSPVMLWGH